MSADETALPLTADAAELLQRKGTLEILVEIGAEGPQRHTDLRKELLSSSSTIQQRLKSGKKINLWEQQLEDRDNVAAKVYTLTELGKKLYQKAENENLHDLYKSRRGINRAIHNRERQVVIGLSPSDAEWIKDISMEEYDDHHVNMILDQFQ